MTLCNVFTFITNNSSSLKNINQIIDIMGHKKEYSYVIWYFNSSSEYGSCNNDKTQKMQKILFNQKNSSIFYLIYRWNISYFYSSNE